MHETLLCSGISLLKYPLSDQEPQGGETESSMVTEGYTYILSIK